MANYLSIEKRKQIFHLLCEGNGLRSISRIIDCSINTVKKFQDRSATIIEYLNRKYIKDLEMQEIEADEIRTYVGNKKNVCWVYIAMDRESRMVIHFHVGSRDANDAEIFLSGLSDKLVKTSKISTDCLQSYISAINRPNSVWLDRFSTEKLELESARYFGKVLGRGITNHIETHNGTVRQHVAKLSRKTKCFAKNIESLKQHMSLFFFYYNFIKRHKTLKNPPAIAAKIISSGLTLEDVMEYDLMFTGKSSSCKRGSYKKHSVSTGDKLSFYEDLEGLISRVKLRIA